MSGSGMYCSGVESNERASRPVNAADEQRPRGDVRRQTWTATRKGSAEPISAPSHGRGRRSSARPAMHHLSRCAMHKICISHPNPCALRGGEAECVAACALSPGRGLEPQRRPERPEKAAERVRGPHLIQRYLRGRPVTVSYDPPQRENCINRPRPLGCHGSDQGVNVRLHITHGQRRGRTDLEDMTAGRDRHSNSAAASPARARHEGLRAQATVPKNAGAEGVVCHSKAGTGQCAIACPGGLRGPHVSIRQNADRYRDIPLSGVGTRRPCGLRADLSAAPRKIPAFPLTHISGGSRSGVAQRQAPRLATNRCSPSRCLSRLLARASRDVRHGFVSCETRW